MDSRKFIFKETGIVSVGTVVGSLIMFGIFALLSMFDQTVLLGGIFGCVVAILNFFFMAMVADLAADKAEEQDVNGGKAMIQRSMLLRTAAMFIIFFALAKSGICNVIALVVPLLFVRPTITIAEFFRKKGDV